MSEPAEKILREALELAPADRAVLIDELVTSLDEPDKNIDELWKVEAESRLKAYREGKIKTVSGKEVFAKLGR